MSILLTAVYHLYYILMGLKRFEKPALILVFESWWWLSNLPSSQLTGLFDRRALLLLLVSWLRALCTICSRKSESGPKRTAVSSLLFLSPSSSLSSPATSTSSSSSSSSSSPSSTPSSGTSSVSRPPVSWSCR